MKPPDFLDERIASASGVKPGWLKQIAVSIALLLKFTEVSLLLQDVPLSTFDWVGSALGGLRRKS